MNTCPLDMKLVTLRGVYCVCPDPTQGIVEMPINGFMVPDPTQGIIEMLIMNRDRIAVHAHHTSPNTPVAIGIRDAVLVGGLPAWSTALGWWFASYGEAILKAQSIGSVVYTS